MSSRPSERPIAPSSPDTENKLAETSSLDTHRLFIQVRDRVRQYSAVQKQPRPKLVLRNIETGEVVWESK